MFFGIRLGAGTSNAYCVCPRPLARPAEARCVCSSPASVLSVRVLLGLLRVCVRVAPLLTHPNSGRPATTQLAPKCPAQPPPSRLSAPCSGSCALPAPPPPRVGAPAHATQPPPPPRGDGHRAQHAGVRGGGVPAAPPRIRGGVEHGQPIPLVFNGGGGLPGGVPLVPPRVVRGRQHRLLHLCVLVQI